MGGILDGFQTGFNMMDRHYRNEESDRRFDEQMGLRRQQDSRQSETHQAQMRGIEQEQALRQNTINDLPNANAYRDENRDLSLQGLRIRNNTARTQNKAANIGLDSSRAKLNSDREDRKKNKAAERFQLYSTTGEWDKFLTDDSFKGTNLELLQNIDGADDAIALTDSISKNDHVGIVSNANRLFKSKLNRNAGKMKGRDGGTVRDISIVGFDRTAEDGNKIPVRVTTDKGTYNSYISELRGIDPSDPDRVYTADELLGTAAAMGNMAHVLKSSGVYDRLAKNAQTLTSSKQASRSSNIPAEVQSVAMLSQMTGIPAEDLVRAKYMSQKDPSGATLRRNALELAQNDPAWEEAQYNDNPAERKKIIDGLINQYTDYLAQPESPATTGQPKTNGQGNVSQYETLLQQASAAIEGGKDPKAVRQRLIEMGVPENMINL